MSRPRNIILLLIIIIALVLVKMFVVGSFFNLIFPEPSRADENDNVTVDIGGDGFLVATIKYSLLVNEKNISDSSFETADGTFRWYGAKNITYVNTFKMKDYLIVWKTTLDKYGWVDENKDINQYISTYLTDRDAKCFIEYSYENKCVYGIVLGTSNISYSESNLMYKVLGLNTTGFDLTYSSSGGGSYYTGSGYGGYHTVVPDRYTLSRTDPGAYYDHYEYGDNYDIDDYLESEGFD
ncbi:hypothetical protein [Methanobrevibacter sp.]|uniref:hypothetical protein n=1 Tax=Methanobrevibacter sp. TaxID=66852 RepID=UPI00388DDF48